MKKTPLTVIALLLAVVLGAGITWAIIHIRFTNATTDNLDDAFYAFVIKEPHAVPSVEDFKTALDSVKAIVRRTQTSAFAFNSRARRHPLSMDRRIHPARIKTSRTCRLLRTRSTLLAH